MWQATPHPPPVLEYGPPRRRIIHWPTATVVVAVAAVLNVLPQFRQRVPPRLSHWRDDELGWPAVFLWNWSGALVFDWQRLAFDLALIGALAFALGHLSCRITRQCSGPS